MPTSLSGPMCCTGVVISSSCAAPSPCLPITWLLLTCVGGGGGRRGEDPCPCVCTMMTSTVQVTLIAVTGVLAVTWCICLHSQCCVMHRDCWLHKPDKLSFTPLFNLSHSPVVCWFSCPSYFVLELCFT